MKTNNVPTAEDFNNCQLIVGSALAHFRRSTQPNKYTIVNGKGNVCLKKFDPDHLILQHELSRGGRLVIDIKYEPDWTDENTP